ncbi:MAG: ACT domain-containing protein [Asticcacaulis sp.]
MNPLIHIELDRLEGSLLRILGLVERRGFHIDELELYDLGEDKRGLTITARARDASRSPETLGLQIDRLYGIKRLSYDPRATQAQQLKAEIGA